MGKFSKMRRKVQFASFAVSSIVFAVALYGIIRHNDNYFESGLLLIGAMLAGGVLLSLSWEGSDAGGCARAGRSSSTLLEKYLLNPVYPEG